MTTYQLRPEFLGEDATLASLYEAGWAIEHSSGGGWWFRHKDGRRQAVPTWILQVAQQCQQGGMKSMQAQLTHLLEPDPHYYGPCLPYTPDPKKKKGAQA